MLDNRLCHGNAAPVGRAILPGQFEANFAKLCETRGGLLFTPTEIDAFQHIADECGFKLDRAAMKPVEV